MLKSQYELVCDSRRQVFVFFKSFKPGDLQKPVTFDGKSMAWLYVHVANTYQGWLVKFARAEEPIKFKYDDYDSVEQLIELFEKVDSMVADFLDAPATQAGHVYQNPAISSQLAVTPLQLFTHVVTHEFHHKGQVLMLARQLGYAPPDTDVIRF
jgi:uncharacterized damage-inducible protein DinB